jgi:hypothetical protein|tara:strand:- start:488 stop:877 length:390 start_codon:yes stop_codon:yes gene_type:complete
MNGQLIEYHNPAPGERYGVIKEKRADGKVTVLTGWYGMSGGNGGGRTSDENSFLKLAPEQVHARQKSIQDHFERLWNTKNGRMASTKTLHFANTMADGVCEGEIEFLPYAVADELVDFFLIHGWFAYAR